MPDDRYVLEQTYALIRDSYDLIAHAEPFPPDAKAHLDAIYVKAESNFRAAEVIDIANLRSTPETAALVNAIENANREIEQILIDSQMFVTPLVNASGNQVLIAFDNAVELGSHLVLLAGPGPGH